MSKALGMDVECEAPSYAEFMDSIEEESTHGPTHGKYQKGREAPNKGIPHSEETKKKISERTKGRKGNITMLGKKHTSEARAKMSASKRGKPASNKGSTWKQKKPNTKLSEIAKKRYKVSLPNGKWTWGYRD